jgi:hypothetical protein
MHEKLSTKSRATNVLNKLRQIKQDVGYNLHDLNRLVFRRNTLLEIVNQTEIRIVGLKRTGNHAVINWMRKQQTGEIWHLNNIKVGQNPYRLLYRHYPKEHLRREAIADFVKKDCLIYSYEDYSLQQVVDRRFEEKHDYYLGRSQKRYDVLLLRDPFNLMASRFKKGYLQVKDSNTNLIDLWISYAKEYLGETKYLNQNKVSINYNQWFTDIDYRKQLAAKLELEFSDAGINEVKGQGDGSSFNGREFDGSASQMDVLARWTAFADHPEYRKLLNNQELLYYSEKIFGHIPGTNSLFQ